MRIALFSPLNPVRTGISDYTEEMLLELSKYFEIDIYISQGYTPRNQEVTSRFRVIPYDPDVFDPGLYKEIVYHMGNYYAAHAYIYDALKRFPGIVVLHDYVLQGFYAEQFEASRDFTPYRALLLRYYGEVGVDIARSIQDKDPVPIWESDEAFTYPLNEEIVSLAKALIVHSDFVGDRIRQKTEKRVVTIPHHGHDLKEFDRAAIRRQYGVEAKGSLICSAGFINRNKRYHRIFPALRDLRDIDFRYAVAGEDRGRILEAAMTAGDDWVTTLGHLTIRQLEGLISASDICINLRYPTMGESSGSLLRMMGYGKPTLVTNHGSYAEFPDFCVLKVDADIDEQEMIRRSVLALIRDEDFRLSLGREAAQFVREECSIEKCAREYAGFISDSAGNSSVGEKGSSHA